MSHDAVKRIQLGTPLEIECEAAGYAEGERDTVAAMATACQAAGIIIHWTMGGSAGEGPACGQPGKCFTWPDGDIITCVKCERIWGNQEVD